MSKVDRDKKIEKLMEKFRSYAKKRQDDPKTRKAAQADFEMLRAVHEGGQISKEESFARGFIASFIGALGKGEKAEKASSRGLGFLHMWMINAASAKAAGSHHKPSQACHAGYGLVAPPSAVVVKSGNLQGQTEHEDTHARFYPTVGLVH